MVTQLWPSHEAIQNERSELGCPAPQSEGAVSPAPQRLALKTQTTGQLQDPRVRQTKPIDGGRLTEG